MALLMVAAGVGLGCAGVKQQPISGTPGTSGSSGTSGGGTTGSAGTGNVITPQTCNGPDGKCTDFDPSATTNPVFGPNVPSSAASSFGTPSGNPPCVTEPEDGTLFPNNWLRPRVRVPGNTGLLKITFHADKETTDLVAYVSGDSWALPKDVWLNLARHVVEEDISVTVQLQSGGATTVKFQVAPVGAAGSMVFWAADPSQVGKTGVETMAQSAVVNDSVLKGFTVGDESTVDTLTIVDVQQQVQTQDGKTQGSHCIGCHVGTPDGNYVGFVDSWPWSAVFAGVKPDPNTMKTGATMPGYAGGPCTAWNTCTTPRTFIQYPWGGPMAFSKAHWTTGDKVAIMTSQMKDVTMPWSTDNWQPGKLTWIDLEQAGATTTNNGQTIPVQGTAFGYLNRTGDPHPAAAFPTWSHDGNSIVYASTVCSSPGGTNGCGTQDGRLYKGQTDLYEIPYAAKQGGNATPVNGAASTTVEEYYPAFSPDDKFIAYTGVPAGTEMYANPSAELYVVAHNGNANTKTVKLLANNPVQCSGKASPGVNNHWPKWAPNATSANGKTYYWLIFSSNRYGLPNVTTNFNGSTNTVEVSQLYVTGLVVDETGVIYSYPAIYLWNQPQNRLNTTPAWENFNIPIVID